MEAFRKKQKRDKRLMNGLMITAAVYLFLYIGVEPFVAKAYGKTAVMIAAYICYGLIVAAMLVLFAYYSKYSKSNSFLENIEYELSDDGYYLTARKERTTETYYKAVCDDLARCGYTLAKDITANEFTFQTRAVKRGELFYIVCEDEVDKNDVIAYLDSAIYDTTAGLLKRKGNAVMLFICDTAAEDAVALSKTVTPLGRKDQLKFTVAIAEMSTGRVYFLGNRVTKCQQMIANFVMDCEVPIKDEYKGKEKLPFQTALEERMQSFNLKDFKEGIFYAH